jgi:predicted  nucleic acid-binding Zn-ribbon protein
VRGADLGAQALAPDPGRVAPVGRLAIAGVQLGHVDAVHEGMRADEARVDAEVDEGRPRPQHARDLGEDRREVVDVRVREHRDRGFEAVVRERQRGGVRLDDLDAA